MRPLLELLVEGREPGDRLIRLPSEGGLSSGLRRWLVEAKVTDRPELQATPTSRPLRWHDLRSTGITWMVLRGDEKEIIQQRAGHRDATTTDLYIKAAETFGTDPGKPFPELPSTLLARAPNPDRNTGSFQRGISNENS